MLFSVVVVVLSMERRGNVFRRLSGSLYAHHGLSDKVSRSHLTMLFAFHKEASLMNAIDQHNHLVMKLYHRQLASIGDILLDVISTVTGLFGVLDLRELSR